MISIVQQIKNSLQNKRFVIFTILFPVTFYIFFIKQLNYVNTEDNGMIALFSAMFGIAGSGLNTFSQKVSKEKGYFRIMDKISPYSYAHYMFDSVMAQTILNILILFFITLAGILVGSLKVTGSYLFIASLLLYFGFCYIVIGFLLGTIFNDETLASASMPIFFAFMMLNITPNIMNTMKMPDIIVTIQKFFPGFYYNEVLLNNTAEKFLQAFLVISLYIVIAGLVTIIVSKSLQVNRRQ
ncbi:ABC transporter permease [Streptococcus hyointestinalis]|uniref:ABC transporter n=1 Tax=Streptococcus hyointestinalis TaxID=1337 RepID=A0A380K1N6_9STRE|nr:ABC transporter permease [Streptococcus hyointestinalis]SUN58093.1 ABC transporter [Streptococcus hyointestinalis]